MKVRQLTVVVVGVLGRQAKRLEDACKKFARVRCVETKRATLGLPPGDYVVIPTALVSHAAQTQAFRSFRRSRVRLHQGGLGRIVGLVESLVRAEA